MNPKSNRQSMGVSNNFSQLSQNLNNGLTKKPSQSTFKPPQYTGYAAVQTTHTITGSIVTHSTKTYETSKSNGRSNSVYITGHHKVITAQKEKGLE